MTDSAGAVKQTYDFDSYGNAVTSTGTLTNPLRYSGQYFDPETGLYYLRARYYDPSTGLFVSRDPMVAITKAPYGYAADTPLNGTDPTGMSFWASVVGGIGTFVGNAIDNLHSSNPALVGLGVAESVVIAAPVAAVLLVAAAAIPIEAVGTLAAGGAAVLGAEVAFDPFDFWGATPSEADQMIPEDWKLGPSQGPGGCRWANPTTMGSEQIRYQQGNPTDDNPIKRDAYFRYSSGRGPKWGAIPAAGNPMG